MYSTQVKVYSYFGGKEFEEDFKGVSWAIRAEEGCYGIIASGIQLPPSQIPLTERDDEGSVPMVLVEFFNPQYKEAHRFFVLMAFDFILNALGGEGKGLQEHDFGECIDRLSAKSISNILSMEYFKEFRSRNNLEISELEMKAWVYRVSKFCVDVLQKKVFIDELEGKESEILNIMTLEKKISSQMNKSLPSLEEMASAVNMSVSKFKILFRDLYSSSPHKYFIRERLEHAALLLMYPDKSITEIAYRVGFNDPSGLTKLFHREMGITPQQYRHLYGLQESETLTAA